MNKGFPEAFKFNFIMHIFQCQGQYCIRQSEVKIKSIAHCITPLRNVLHICYHVITLRILIKILVAQTI